MCDNLNSKMVLRMSVYASVSIAEVGRAVDTERNKIYKTRGSVAEVENEVGGTIY